MYSSFFKSEKTKLLSFIVKKEKQPYHLVTKSPWPFVVSAGLGTLLLTFVMYFHQFEKISTSLHLSLFITLIAIISWWEDVIEESTFEGNHTKKVIKGLKLGMMLFIVSEAMLFFSFFWAFFHSSLAPSPWIGGIWPPLDIEPIDAWGLPLGNTLLLLFSGLTVTWSHKATISGKLNQAFLGLLTTVVVGSIFLVIQFYEYKTSQLRINDSVFGSCFFMITGLHGLHVLAGTTYLAVNLWRIYLRHFTRKTHFGYEAAIWYWHFVDIVWILVFLFIYWWGGN